MFIDATTKQAFILLNTITGKSQTVPGSSRIADCNKIWYDRVFHKLLEKKICSWIFFK